MQTVIYTRFSPRRNAEESESCETQEALCREYAAKQGWEVRVVYADKDMSGSDSDRPGLRDAVASLRAGDVLLVYKRDRLARDVLIAELTRRQVAAAGATIAAVSGDIAGDDKDPTVAFTRQIMDAVAELERKQISARTRDSMRQLLKQGRRVTRFPPYGWKQGEFDQTSFVPNETEVAAVERIKSLSASGLGVGAIRRTMDEEMPQAARTGRWNRKAIERVLRRS